MTQTQQTIEDIDDGNDIDIQDDIQDIDISDDDAESWGDADENNEKASLDLFEDISDLDISLTFQKTDRILSEDEKISVQKIGISSDEFASTNVKNKLIRLNFEKIKNSLGINNEIDFMILSKGLNYHELAHINYTDYDISKIQSFLSNKIEQDNRNASSIYIDTNQFFSYANMLEDCRIETLFSIEYPKAKDYFTFCAGNILLASINKNIDRIEHIKELSQNYLLLYGRKFLSFNPQFRDYILNLRKIIIKRYPTKEDFIVSGEKLFDKYIVTIPLNDRLEIIWELFKLFEKEGIGLDSGDKPSPSKDSIMNCGRKNRNQINNIRKLINELLKRLNQEAKKEKSQMSQKGKNKKDKTKEDHPSNDLQDINNLEEDENKGKGKGKNKKDKPQNPAKKLKSILENNEEIKKQIEDFTRLIIQNINENRELQNEIRKEVNKIVSSKKEFGDFSGEIFNKSATDEIESKKIEEVLRILRGDLSFKLNRFQKRGKIDMISMIKARQNNNLNMFKKKRLNKIDKSKLGVSILLDTSGSISLRDFKEEIKATWCLSKALENLGNFVEVIEFSKYYRHMKKFASQGDWKRSYGSSTSVCEPLKCSISDLMVLKSSKKINNLFVIIISDGCFDENIETVKIFIDDAHKKKIKVIWICASNLHNKDNGKYFDWDIRIKNLSELSRELNKIIREIQREINKNIAQESMCLGA